MDAAVEFVYLGYLQLLIVLFKLITVTNPPSPPPPHSAASEFDANLTISVFTKLNQILNSLPPRAYLTKRLPHAERFRE